MTFDYNRIPFSDLSALFDYCNTRYFNNEIKTTPQVEWSSKMLRVLGLAKSSNGIYKITLSESLKNDNKELLNVMVHEMIHIWQYQKYHETGLKKYLDKTVTLSIGQRKGHGQYFQHWMNSLNERHPELKIHMRADKQVMENISGDETETYYAALVSFNSSGKNLKTIYWSRDDFRANINNTINSIVELYGIEKIEQIQTFETMEPRICETNSLTSTGTLRKNARMNSFKQSDINNFLNHHSVIVDEPCSLDKKTKHALASNVTINKEILELLPRTTSLRHYGLKDYINIILHNTTFGKDIKHPGDVLMGQCDCLQKEDIDFIIQHWNAAKKEEISKSMLIKNFAHNIAVEVIRNQGRESVWEGKDTGIIAIWHKIGEKRIPLKELNNIIEKKAAIPVRKVFGAVASELVSSYMNKFPITHHLSTISNVIERTVVELHKGKEDFVRSVVSECYQSSLPVTPEIMNVASACWEKFPQKCYIATEPGFRIKKILSSMLTQPHTEISEMNVNAIHELSEQVQGRVTPKDFILEILKHEAIEALKTMKLQMKSLESIVELNHRARELSLLLTNVDLKKKRISEENASYSN